MKAFGFDDADILRGEMKAANVDAWIIRDYPDRCAGEQGWEFASPRFSEAKTELLRRMREDQVDPEMIAQVEGLKASYIPVEDC
ncbi:hypothetical protein EZI54_03890 [Marinobacter halodurans]|uniref:Uncharacterized protein n=1 Tax=Marinobacter halodurans TaxID=2528979 RepID=A0ABY1ZS59_9GAMM|nr:hypothetical protein [Marinobacter halodurans]TBW58534.1 hypothetical protein EZI54_03890 [Marinobacter halodurans]